MIFGLGHKKQRGKSTFANFLLDELLLHGEMAIIMPFAFMLKHHIGRGIFGLSNEQLNDLTLKETIDPYWSMTPRAMLQGAGQGLRQCVSPDVWVKALFREIALLPPEEHVIIPDVRYWNEADAIKSREGCLIRIDRPLPDDDLHPSEQELSSYDKWDWRIYNEGSIASLKEQAKHFARETVLSHLPAGEDEQRPAVDTDWNSSAIGELHSKR